MPKADPTDSPVREGDVIADKYRVEKVLGIGGMGIVVAARHVTLDERFAIKFLLRDAMKSKESQQRFLQEAKSVVRLKSEHVARVVDVATLPTGEPYMVMEHLDGSDLGELIDTGKITPAEAVSYIRQACDALAEAHSLGIVHRDLKPENLFLADLGRGKKSIKVLDFGISKSTDPSTLSLTQTTAVMGSPLYMSPEQMKATRNVDARTDIWSLGVTLYEMLCGEVPFVAESAMALGAKVMHDQPTSPSDVRPELPRELSAVILKCLEKSPANRFANVTDLQLALEPFQGAALPASPSKRTVVSIPASEEISMGTTMSASGAVSVNTSRSLATSKNRRFVLYALGAAAVGIGTFALFAHRSAPAAIVVSQDPATTASITTPPPPPMHVASASEIAATPTASEAPTVPVATASAGASSKKPSHHSGTHVETSLAAPPVQTAAPAQTTAPATTATHAQPPDDPYGHM